MILKVEAGDELWMKAFLVPQDIHGNEPLDTYILSVNEIEQVTGLNFNPLLSPVLADSLEYSVPDKLWNIE